VSDASIRVRSLDERRADPPRAPIARDRVVVVLARARDASRAPVVPSVDFVVVATYRDISYTFLNALARMRECSVDCTNASRGDAPRSDATRRRARPTSGERPNDATRFLRDRYRWVVSNRSIDRSSRSIDRSNRSIDWSVASRRWTTRWGSIANPSARATARRSSAEWIEKNENGLKRQGNRRLKSKACVS